jgi:hypothetical protein
MIPYVKKYNFNSLTKAHDSRLIVDMEAPVKPIHKGLKKSVRTLPNVHNAN